MKSIARRSFLTGLGAALAALPFVPLLDPEAEALAAEFPNRFLVFCTTTGMTGRYPNNFKPSGGETGFTLSPILQPLAGGYSEHGLPIEDLSSDVIITQGIDMEAAYDSPSVGGHPRGMGVLLTATPIMEGTLFDGGGSETAGWAGGISVDQFIAEAIGMDTAFSSLELGVDNFGGVEHLRYVLSYKGKANPLPVESDPYKAFDRIFGDFVSDDPAALAILKKRRQSVIDLVRAELEGVNGRLGAADRHKLDAHLDAIRSIEKRLAAGIGAGCEPPVFDGGVDPKSDNELPDIGRMQMDLLVAALACDVTRVGSIMWGPAPYGSKFSFLPEMLGVDGMHPLSHAAAGDTGAQNQLEAIARFYARQFAYLLQKLKSIPEGTGTMLDNTVVLWCSEVSAPNTHSHRNMPFVIGGSGGYFDTGRFLQYSGEPHNKLFVSICHAMGMTNTTFGDPKYGSGPLSGLS